MDWQQTVILAAGDGSFVLRGNWVAQHDTHNERLQRDEQDGISVFLELSVGIGETDMQTNNYDQSW